MNKAALHVPVPAGAVPYRISAGHPYLETEVAVYDAAGNLVWTAIEKPGVTTFPLPVGVLQSGKQYTWTARTRDPNGGMAGAWTPGMWFQVAGEEPEPTPPEPGPVVPAPLPDLDFAPLRERLRA